MLSRGYADDAVAKVLSKTFGAMTADDISNSIFMGKQAVERAAAVAFNIGQAAQTPPAGRQPLLIESLPLETAGQPLSPEQAGQQVLPPGDATIVIHWTTGEGTGEYASVRIKIPFGMTVEEFLAELWEHVLLFTIQYRTEAIQPEITIAYVI